MNLSWGSKSISTSFLWGMMSFTLMGSKCSGQCTGEGRPRHPVLYALSPVYLQYLEVVEHQFYGIMKAANLSELVPELQSLTESYIAEYERNVPGPFYIASKAAGAAATFTVSSNPILTLQMISRFIKYKDSNIYAILGQGLIEDTALPIMDEFVHTIDAIFLLQYFYDLKAHELADGIINGVPTDARLSSTDCFELVHLLHEKRYFSLTLQWLDAGLAKLKNEESKLTEKNEEDEEYVKYKEAEYEESVKSVIKEHNKHYVKAKMKPTITGNDLTPDFFVFTAPLRTLGYSKNAHLTERKRLIEDFAGKIILNKNDAKFKASLRANMLALCSGRNFQKEGVKKGLKCYWDNTRGGYWRVKVEVLSEDPRVVQFYDILGDRKVKILKKEAYYRLARAPVLSQGPRRKVATAFLEDDEGMPELGKGIEAITGLKVEGASDEVQISAYATGGYVSLHLDGDYDEVDEDDKDFEEENQSAGYPVVTFMAYLNDVEIGGLTAFPLLGLAVKPVKNSALVWYNNLRNGQVDERMLHLACPVVKGQKWVATKWIRSNANIFKHPCGLSPEE